MPAPEPNTTLDWDETGIPAEYPTGYPADTDTIRMNVQLHTGSNPGTRAGVFGGLETHPGIREIDLVIPTTGMNPTEVGIAVGTVLRTIADITGRLTTGRPTP